MTVSADLLFQTGEVTGMGGGDIQLHKTKQGRKPLVLFALREEVDFGLEM